MTKWHLSYECKVGLTSKIKINSIYHINGLHEKNIIISIGEEKLDKIQ